MMYLAINYYSKTTIMVRYDKSWAGHNRESVLHLQTVKSISFALENDKKWP